MREREGTRLRRFRDSFFVGLGTWRLECEGESTGVLDTACELGVGGTSSCTSESKRSAYASSESWLSASPATATTGLLEGVEAVGPVDDMGASETLPVSFVWMTGWRTS